MNETHPGFSESCHLDCVSDDGLTGFNLRIARYPVRGTAILWAYVFLPDAIYGSNDAALPLGEFTGVTTQEADDVSYELAAPMRVHMRRRGGRAGMTIGEIDIDVGGYRGAEAPVGCGPERIKIRASIQPRFMSPTPAGRLEAHGPVTAEVEVDGRRVKFAALGQWHEEARPRVAADGLSATPFTYVTLRGPELTLVARSSEGQSRGWVNVGAKQHRIAHFEIADEGARRPLRIVLDDGSEIAGDAEVLHDYFVGTMSDRRRPGAIAVVETNRGRLSGLINYTTNRGPPPAERRIGGVVHERGG